MFVSGDGVVALQNSGGTLVLANEQSDLDGDLGLGDMEASPYLRFDWERDSHHVRVDGFGLDVSGSGVLTGDYGNILANTPVNTSLEFLATTASYAYEVLGDRDYRIGLGGRLSYYGLDVSTNSGTVEEKVETSVVVPMPYAEIEYFAGPVTLGANGSIMAADLNDADGRYIDAEAVIRWQASEEVEVLAGYRYVLLDAHGRATSRDFDADVDFAGFFLGGGIRF